MHYRVPRFSEYQSDGLVGVLEKLFPTCAQIVEPCFTFGGTNKSVFGALPMTSKLVFALTALTV
jgi:hypothetical protein